MIQQRQLFLSLHDHFVVITHEHQWTLYAYKYTARKRFAAAINVPGNFYLLGVPFLIKTRRMLDGMDTGERNFAGIFSERLCYFLLCIYYCYQVSIQKNKISWNYLDSKVDVLVYSMAIQLYLVSVFVQYIFCLGIHGHETWCWLLCASVIHTVNSINSWRFRSFFVDSSNSHMTRRAGSASIGWPVGSKRDNQ